MVEFRGAVRRRGCQRVFFEGVVLKQEEWGDKGKSDVCDVKDKKMVSDAEIVRQLTAVLRQADLNTTTTTAIRQQLQRDLGVDLSEKKLFIRQQVDLYLLKQSQEQQEDVEGKGKEEADDEGGEETGERDQEDDEDGVGIEDEQDENGSRKTGKCSKTRGEPESKRMRAKIDRAIKARYRESLLCGIFECGNFS